MTMKTNTFEIKVALLGYVSAGKSTVLNAILQGKFSEVAMRRTTAGVNFFRIYNKEATNEGGDVLDTPMGVSTLDSSWRIDPESTQTADQTLETITDNNKKHRETNQIHESTFDVVLDEPLCEMRKDTNLVLIDVPGLNEAGSKDLYRNYVNEKWSTFDCVIAVMDVNQGVNTEEQVELIKLIQKNSTEMKDVPVIVLCNKVDDLEDEEILVLVNEVRAKVEEIFKTSASDTSVDGCDAQVRAKVEGMFQTLATTGSTGTVDCGARVNFLPISAGNAFVYRTASRLSFDDFKKLDKNIIERLGRDEIGKSKWRKMTQCEKYTAAFAVTSCAETYDGSLEATNFHLFLDTLNRFVGGHATQAALLQKQLDVSLKTLMFDGKIAQELKVIRDKNICLGLSPFPYEDYFWKWFEARRSTSIKGFREDIQDRSSLQDVMSQLVDYHAFIRQSGDNKVELDKTVQAMLSLVRTQINVLAENAHDLEGWTKKGSLVDVPLYDWDTTANCWRMDSVDCSQCNGSSDCQNEAHFLLCSVPNDAGEWERHSNGWRNTSTGKVALGKKYENKKKPPGDSPHHWKLVSGGWKNIHTGRPSSHAHHPVLGKLSWESLSPRDYFTMSTSMLLLSHSKTFCEYFGREKSVLEGMVIEYYTLTQRLSSKYASFFDGTPGTRGRAADVWLNKLTQGAFNDEGVFIPKYPRKYKLVARIEMPSDLSDPNHWGNLAWQFCHFMETKKA